MVNLSWLIFTDKVVNLRAWQLYLGNGIWTLLVGLILLIITKLLGMAGINSSELKGALGQAAGVTSGRNNLRESFYQ